MIYHASYVLLYSITGISVSVISTLFGYTLDKWRVVSYISPDDRHTDIYSHSQHYITVEYACVSVVMACGVPEVSNYSI